ncbi:thioredoxin-like protein [Anaeramoeba flamelloides]|uniref:Thioredoxin-like protein n=1 Tax=Anaeramoeba flamelloides TaxID=1746091 RepID=A0AAV7ZTF5_9EUKA|nr:thioredoxin-like protein [Anaeramoeba flamelloides]
MSTGNVIHINDENEFTNHIKNSGTKLVVVDWYANWCGPCKMIAPVLTQFSLKYTNVVFLKVDVDKLKQLATVFGITKMPTFTFFKGGNKIHTMSGANPEKLEQKIIELIDYALPKTINVDEKSEKPKKKTQNENKSETVHLVTQMDELQELLKANSTKIAIVFFSAEWSKPSQRISGVFEEFSISEKGFLFIKVDVDNSTEIVEEYEILSTPTIFFNKITEEGGLKQNLATITGGNVTKFKRTITNLKK